MFTSSVGPVEFFFYWPEAVVRNFYWPGARGSLLSPKLTSLHSEDANAKYHMQISHAKMFQKRNRITNVSTIVLTQKITFF